MRVMSNPAEAVRSPCRGWIWAVLAVLLAMTVPAMHGLTGSYQPSDQMMSVYRAASVTTVHGSPHPGVLVAETTKASGAALVPVPHLASDGGHSAAHQTNCPATVRSAASTAIPAALTSWAPGAPGAIAPVAGYGRPNDRGPPAADLTRLCISRT